MYVDRDHDRHRRVTQTCRNWGVGKHARLIIAIFFLVSVLFQLNVIVTTLTFRSGKLSRRQNTQRI